MEGVFAAYTLNLDKNVEESHSSQSTSGKLCRQHSVDCVFPWPEYWIRSGNIYIVWLGDPDEEGGLGGTRMAE